MTFAHLDQTRATVAELGDRFDRAGHRLYLVGGIVRDQWLDQPLGVSADIDLTTDAAPSVTKALITDLADALWTQGERFGTIGLQFNDHAIEITTHRSETYLDDSRKPQVAFGTDIEVDLSRRDFTVNAMAVDIATGDLIDPWGGAADLAAGVLRTPLVPEVSFSDDPLRMLRAARFAARFDLRVDSGVIDAATDMRERLRIVAIERIGDELRRLFRLPDSTVGLAFLHHTGLLHELIGWKRPQLSIPDASLASACAAVGRLGPIASTQPVDPIDESSRPAGPERDWFTLRLATLLADLALRDPSLGAPIDVADTTARLRLAGAERRSVTALAASAGALLELADASEGAGSSDISAPNDDAALRRWRSELRAPASYSFDVAGALIDPDESDRAESLERLWARFRDLGAREPESALTPLDGTQIMAVLGIAGGPEVGQAMKVLRRALWEKGPLPAAAQIEILKRWWLHRQPST